MFSDRAPQRETSVRSCAHFSSPWAEDTHSVEGGSNFYLPGKSSKPPGTSIWSKVSRWTITMSASSAKVSRKENSNHDGADETSGNVKEWRLSCPTPFSFVYRHFVMSTGVCCPESSWNDIRLWTDSLICLFLRRTLSSVVKRCCSTQCSMLKQANSLASVRARLAISLH